MRVGDMKIFVIANCLFLIILNRNRGIYREQMGSLWDCMSEEAVFCQDDEDQWEEDN